MVRKISAKAFIGIGAGIVLGGLLLKSLFNSRKLPTPAKEVAKSVEKVSEVVTGPSEKVVKAVAKPVEKVVKPVVKEAEKVVKKVGRLVKGSPEAKAWAAKMKEARNNKKTKHGEGTMAKRSKARKAKLEHKGHATKRGLAQDQKLVSKEKHEKAFQKSKK